MAKIWAPVAAPEASATKVKQTKITIIQPHFVVSFLFGTEFLRRIILDSQFRFTPLDGSRLARFDLNSISARLLLQSPIPFGFPALLSNRI